MRWEWSPIATAEWPDRLRGLVALTKREAFWPQNAGVSHSLHTKVAAVSAARALLTIPACFDRVVYIYVCVCVCVCVCVRVCVQSLYSSVYLILDRRLAMPRLLAAV